MRTIDPYRPVRRRPLPTRPAVRRLRPLAAALWLCLAAGLLPPLPDPAAPLPALLTPAAAAAGAPRPAAAPDGPNFGDFDHDFDGFSVKSPGVITLTHGINYNIVPPNTATISYTVMVTGIATFDLVVGTVDEAMSCTTRAGPPGMQQLRCARPNLSGTGRISAPGSPTNQFEVVIRSTFCKTPGSKVQVSWAVQNNRDSETDIGTDDFDCAPNSRSFGDVSQSDFSYGSVEELFVRGVTTGCVLGADATTRRYCPTGSVRRDEMAIFLVRAIRGPNFALPPAQGNVFADVSTGTFGAAFIEELFRLGVTTGCVQSSNPAVRRYCPLGNVRRDEMALFLLRGKFGPGYQPPAAQGNVFADVQTTTFAAAAMEDLFAKGITTGCLPSSDPAQRRYCPAGNVRRDEMAAFLIRTFFP